MKRYELVMSGEGSFEEILNSLKKLVETVEDNVDRDISCEDKTIFFEAIEYGYNINE